MLSLTRVIFGFLLFSILLKGGEVTYFQAQFFANIFAILLTSTYFNAMMSENDSIGALATQNTIQLITLMFTSLTYLLNFDGVVQFFFFFLMINSTTYENLIYTRKEVRIHRIGGLLLWAQILAVISLFLLILTDLPTEKLVPLVSMIKAVEVAILGTVSFREGLFFKLPNTVSKEFLLMRLPPACGSALLVSNDATTIVTAVFVRLKTLLDIAVPTLVRNNSKILVLFLFFVITYICYAFYLFLWSDFELLSYEPIFFLLAGITFVFSVLNSMLVIDNIARNSMPRYSLFFSYSTLVIVFSFIFFDTSHPYMYFAALGVSFYILRRYGTK